MKKNLLWMAAAIVSCGLAFTACAVEDVPSSPNQGGEGANVDEWEINFEAYAAKYVDKTGTTISAEVADGLGTCSIVNGTLVEPAEDGSTTASEEYDPRFALQTGTTWLLHPNLGVNGLYQGNSGGRNFGVLNAKKEQLITLVMTAEPTVNVGNVDLYSKTDSSYTYFVNEDGNVRFNVARYNVIRYISVKNFVGVEYTVRFIDSTGKKVKDDVTHKGEVGKPVNLLPGDIAPIDLEDGGRLVFDKANNTETNVVKKDGSTVITVLYRDAEKYYAVLNCMAGSTLLYRYNDVKKDWFYEGDALTIYPPRGIMKDGAAYFTPVMKSSNGKYYNYVYATFPGELNPTVSGGKTYYIGTVNYEKEDSVVYYSEFERLALPKEDAGDGNGTGLGQLEGTVNSWWSFSGGVFDRFSGARGIRLDKDSYVWTEPIAEEGTYKVTINGRNDIAHNKKGINCPQPYIIGVRDAEGKVTWLDDVTVPDWADSTTGSNVVENVKIPAGSSLVIGCDGSTVTFDDGTVLPKSISLDDISICKQPAE